MNHYIGLIELALAAWVAYDSSKLGAKRGRLGGGMLDMGPVAWFFCCFLCFIVGFVCYLVNRPKLVAMRDSAARPRGMVPSQFNQFGPVQPQFTGPQASYAGPRQAAAPAPSAPLPPGPPPGWYPDPSGTATSRWWNGGTWTTDTH